MNTGIFLLYYKIHYTFLGLKIDSRKLGLIAFNNMIPVKENEIIKFNFDEEDENYKKLLKKQFMFCNKSSNKSIIQNKAEKTYNKVVVKKDKFMCKVSCDFKLLEEKCLDYN